MQTTFVHLNSVLTHADVVTSTTAPSGSTFTATDAAVKTEFLFTPEHEQKVAYHSWRILIQVLAMQMTDYKQAHGQEDAELWKSRMLSTLEWINRKAQEFYPQSIPSNIVPPTAEYLALNVTGNWCDILTKELTQVFLSVPGVDTLKISQWTN